MAAMAINPLPCFTVRIDAALWSINAALTARFATDGDASVAPRGLPAATRELTVTAVREPQFVIIWSTTVVSTTLSSSGRRHGRSGPAGGDARLLGCVDVADGLQPRDRLLEAAVQFLAPFLESNAAG